MPSEVHLADQAKDEQQVKEELVEQQRQAKDLLRVLEAVELGHQEEEVEQAKRDKKIVEVVDKLK